MAETNEAPEIVYRKLLPGDRRLFEAHLLALDPASRQMRFGMAASDAFLEQYAERCINLNATIHAALSGGLLIGVAELRPFGAFLANEAEIAFSVATECRNRGIGSQLFARTLRSARNRGYRRLYMCCLRHNAPMQALARKFAAEISVEQEESFALVEAAPRTVLSLMREVLDDAGAITSIAMEWQRRALLRRGEEPRRFRPQAQPPKAGGMSS